MLLGIRLRRDSQEASRLSLPNERAGAPQYFFVARDVSVSVSVGMYQVPYITNARHVMVMVLCMA